MKDKRGTTILETLLSALLLAFLIIFLLNLYPGAMSAVHTSEHQTRADTIAQSLLEQEVSQPFSALVVGTTYQFDTQVWDQVYYQPTLEVFKVADRDPTVLLGLRLTVAWSERGPRQVAHEVWVSNVHH